MATLYITEFVDCPRDGQGRALGQFANQPPIAEQTVAIAVGSNQSAQFNSATKFVRVHADVICSIEFGTNPAATATKARMAAGQTEYFGVNANATKIAVIQNS